MSKGINKWIGIGNLGADPETRYTQSGSAVTNIRIGCTERYKGKDGARTGVCADCPETNSQ